MASKGNNSRYIYAIYGTSFVSEDLIHVWPGPKPRAISHPRKQNSVPYIAYTPYYYTIYTILHSGNIVPVRVCHFDCACVLAL